MREEPAGSRRALRRRPPSRTTDALRAGVLPLEARGGACTLVGVEVHLADAHDLGRDLDAFVVARELEAGGADWGYIWLETLDGPLFFVAVQGLVRGDIGDASACELAGADGAGDYVPPIVREIEADAGDRGVYVERHSPMDADQPLAQVVSGSYAFESPEGVVLMQTSTLDMAGYERFRPRYEEFARTFAWDRG